MSRAVFLPITRLHVFSPAAPGIPSRLKKPAIPILAIAGLAFLSLGIETGGTDSRDVAGAVGLVILTLLISALAPWARLPRSSRLLLPLGMLGMIGLLRDAQGGSTSGYAPLVMLPVIWVALTLRRREVFGVAAATALLFGLPIVLAGAPLYPSSGWRGTVLWTAVALSIGLIVNAVVDEQRRQSSIAHERAEEIDELQTVFRSIARIARRISVGSEARDLTCTVALEACSAAIAAIIEPQQSGGFAVTGSAGASVRHVDLDPLGPIATAFSSGQPVFVPDVRAPNAPAGVAAEVASILCYPILIGDQPLGVLCIGWALQRAELDARNAAICAYLVAEAASVIEGADLVTRLDGLARTDQLTGIANRRQWDEQLERTAADSTVHPFCIALIDLDHFKEFNDRHGHLEGDALLQAATNAWRAELRGRDLLSRVGGEEFAVLLPECSAADAELVLQRVRLATPRGVTCSVGLAERVPGEDSPDLTARADAALYRAKAAGRDRLKVA